MACWSAISSGICCGGMSGSFGSSSINIGDICGFLTGKTLEIFELPTPPCWVWGNGDELETAAAVMVAYAGGGYALLQFGVPLGLLSHVLFETGQNDDVEDGGNGNFL